ncbi:hypothetical protein OCO_29330 [Mycobacterium intracellulare MOTT-02]|uniref:Uncharacterized protein n=2 Tax=Mycobacterium intracellulare TaxID=1767 RepID=X8CTY2_MYCIT|nr:hypothetical protein OCU_29240 [Mycobacterium intracellulare ATCC 13950]AFC49296.1 hypothetical protein OCO_29330 [Mycobacterium intracellulare MOTT-02]EUA27825.1 hypothetical protein I548_5935 [Mycobacterium intracellulare]EUA59847.1 hypothetical protein I550_2996 [Mycobacterium intracellulare 1956]
MPDHRPGLVSWVSRGVRSGTALGCAVTVPAEYVHRVMQ